LTEHPQSIEAAASSSGGSGCDPRGRASGFRPVFARI
jgi:hypothetical protein